MAPSCFDGGAGAFATPTLRRSHACVSAHTQGTSVTDRAPYLVGGPFGSGYPYVAIPQMKEGRLDVSSARRISHADYVEWTRKARPQPGDIVLSRRCNPGETAYPTPGLEFAVGQNLLLLRPSGVFRGRRLRALVLTGYLVMAIQAR